MSTFKKLKMNEKTASNTGSIKLLLYFSLFKNKIYFLFVRKEMNIFKLLSIGVNNKKNNNNSRPSLPPGVRAFHK